MEIQKRTLPHQIQNYASSLTPQERFEHRSRIGVRIEALLDSFWDKNPPEAVQEIIVRDWLDALDNFPPDEIESACKEYLLGESRRHKPKTGDIVSLINSARKRLLASHPKIVQLDPPPRKSGSSEERSAFATETIRKVYGESREHVGSSVGAAKGRKK